MKLRARTDEEKQLKREKLLDSARVLFPRHGYQGTTIEMITANAGLSPAAFYLYFSSKTVIYRALNARGIDILQKEIEEQLASAGVSAREKIGAIARAYFRFFTGNRDYYDIIAILHLGQGEFFTNPDKVPDLEARTSELLSLIAGIIQEGVEKGVFSDADPWRTAVTLWGMIDGVLLLEVKKSTSFTKVRIEQAVERMTEIVVRALEI
jgi:AcrR family transcriptional regulator